MADALKYLDTLLGVQLFMLGGSPLTVGSLTGMLLATLLLLMFSRLLRNWMLERLPGQSHLDPSTRQTIASLTQYAVVAMGLVLILDGAGVKLSSFTVLAGALGVGVGFGLQNIFSNFISGLIVMFERPVKIGDHIIAGGVEGDVMQIGMRATTLITAQGSQVIVPNQNFITGNVVNWNRGSQSAGVLQWRMMGKIEDDEALLLRAAAGVPDVLRLPMPCVFVISTDYAGHVMELHVGLSGDARKRLACISAINKAVMNELARLGQSLAHNP